ncbi:hypothetical protein FOBRF1_012906 [Fusarium oxysporum]
MDTDICPDGDTRTQKEMVVKLIVAHFTAVVAFCNFQSLRNERLDTIEPILFLLSPLIVIAQTALGIIIINVSFVSNVAQSPKSLSLHLETYARRWNTLFGKKTSQPRRTPTGSLETMQSRFGSAWIRLGRAVAIFATLFQFAATIFLYRRRKELYGWDSLTVVDHRTFELSVGGAAVSILSLALLLKFPGFGQAPEALYIPELKPDPAVIFCRGDSRRCPSWYQILYDSDIGSATSAATWLACVLSSTYKGESIPLHFLCEFYAGIYTETARVFSLQISMPIFYLLVAVFFATSPRLRPPHSPAASSLAAAFTVFESSTASGATTSTTQSTTESITTTTSTAELGTITMETMTKPETTTVETISATTTTKITGPTCGGPGTPCNTSNFQQI